MPTRSASLVDVFSEMHARNLICDPIPKEHTTTEERVQCIRGCRRHGNVLICSWGSHFDTAAKGPRTEESATVSVLGHGEGGSPKDSLVLQLLWHLPTSGKFKCRIT